MLTFSPDAISNDHLPETASAVDLLVQQIKTYIQENHLAIGDALPANVRTLKAARNTVREAIRILESFMVKYAPKSAQSSLTAIPMRFWTHFFHIRAYRQKPS